MGILHAHRHRGPQCGLKMTRDNPKVAAFCFVRLTMLVCDLPVQIFICIFGFLFLPTSYKSMHSGFLFLPTSHKSRMGILYAHGHRGPHGGPKTTRDTSKVAAFCFVCLMMLVCNSPKIISSYRTVCGSQLLYLSLE